MKLLRIQNLKIPFLVINLYFCVVQNVKADQIKTLIFLDNSVSNDTYIPSNKENQIEVAFEIAKSDLLKQFPKCKLKFEKRIDRGDQLNIFKQAEKIKSELKPESSIIIGLIHSSEAILAAKAFADSKFQVLSSGATTENLNDLNSNFYTLANPVSSFNDQIMNFVKFKKPKVIFSLIPGNSSYAKEFSKDLGSRLIASGIKFEEIEYNPSSIEADLNRLKSKIKNADMIFAPGFIQQSLAAVSYLDKFAPEKTIVGTPNWGRSIPDLLNFYKKLNISKSKLYFPISWISGESKNSKSFETKFKKKLNEVPMGTAVYTYDAAIIAGSFACNSPQISSERFLDYLKDFNYNKLTSRKYQRFLHGHMTSPIYMVEFKGTDKILPIKNLN